MALRDQPYLPLYVQDYLTDEKLNECSAATQGIFVKLMCLMHKSDEYGTILLRQKDKQSKKQINNFASKLVKHLPFSEKEITDALNELLSEKVLHLEGDKIYQKRMVKDNKLSLIRSKVGKLGGESTHFGKAKHKAKHKAKTQANTENETVIENVNEDLIKKIKVEMRPTFNDFWNLYDKKVDRKESEIKWKRLKQEEKEAIMIYIPKYKEAQPDKQYRKDPERFLKKRKWLDELMQAPSKNGFPNKYDVDFTKKCSGAELSAYWKHLRDIGLKPVKNHLNITVDWK